MKRLLAAALATPLLLGGCAAKDVNEYSVFKYGPEDGVPLTAAKTLGNIVPWTMLAAGTALVVPVTIAALCRYQP